MANNLTVTISAVDKATATIKRINDSMNRAVAPVRNIQRIGSEVAKNPVIDSLRRMGGAVGTVAKGLGIVSGSMAGITAIGAVAGVAEMTAQWARLAREIDNTSVSLGTTSKGLVTMRGAARLAGLSAEAMDGSLESVRQTMQDARWGRNQPLVALMTKLGMTFRYTKDGSIDAIASLKDIADAMAAQPDVGAKHTVAQAFGVDALYPLLIKGKKAIEDYQASAEKLGAVPNDAAIKRAEKFAESISKLKLTLDGMKSQVGDSLISASQSSLDWLNRFTTKKSYPWADAVVREFGRLFGDDPNEDRPEIIEKPAAKSAPLRINSPLGIRSNNPLNLQPKGREAVFSTMEAGIAAAVKNLMGSAYFGGGNDTVAGIVSRWSPANAPGNSVQKTANYISAVQSEVGTGHLNANDPSTMAKLLSAMIRQENGAGSYDPSKMDETIKHVLIEFKNAPSGMTATARGASGKNMPVRIVQAMSTDVGGP
jgi:hypothetical protein